jgi:hypothetical protein
LFNQARKSRRRAHTSRQDFYDFIPKSITSDDVTFSET